MLLEGTLINDNEYLDNLQNGKELIVYTEEQLRKLSVYFDIKRYLQSKNISYSLNVEYFT